MTPRRLLIVLAALLALAGCDAAAAPTPAVTSVATIAPGPATTADVPTIGPPPSADSSDAAEPLAIDSSLLAVLPAAVSGAPVTEDVDEASSSISDPLLSNVASGLDAGVAVDAGNANLVYAVVVRLRPGTFGDGAFRQWRDTYDQGACSQAGDVAGHAEAQIAGRTVYIGTCGALHTYHTWIQDKNLLVSASALGDAKFGELLMAGLRP